VNYAFRVDASVAIGTGHVMRCLTLADALREQGGRCHFVTRAHAGHLGDLVLGRGHALHLLGAAAAGVDDDPAPGPTHAGWLGTTWQVDAAQTLHVLEQLRPDWLVVDHYALDADWEAAVGPAAGRLLVVDDLADRTHACDMLLDQNLGAGSARYAGRVPAACVLLEGPAFALLKPGFARVRAGSLARRAGQARLEHLLVALGGVDADDLTGTLLGLLRRSELPDLRQVTVVLGPSARWIERVRALARQLPWPTDVLVGTDDMPGIMARSDLSIGAAGVTGWERCCVGLPALVVVLADNQRRSAHGLRDAGAALILAEDGPLPESLRGMLGRLQGEPGALEAMAQCAAAVCDGEGVRRVLEAMRTVEVQAR
jgi:UDP-2,4-diacetamido-2,4,6-trideoxy-beta-L-altropyranose hydrolase